MSTALENLLSRFPSARKNGSEWKALCPAHKDRNPSLSITEKDGTVLLHCFAGCSQDSVLEAAGIDPKELFARNSGTGRNEASGAIVATYDYVNENGELLYQVTRHDPKDFRVRRRNGKGGWIWGIGNTRRVLYNLPQVIAANLVFAVEGEKDANTAVKIGIVATTNVFGAGKWQNNYSETLRGKDVVIIADADETGRNHAKLVGTSLHLRAKSIKMIEMPNAKDLSEWVEAIGDGASAEQLKRLVLALAEDAPEWESSDAAEEKELPNWRNMFHTVEEFENAPPLSFAIENFLQHDAVTGIVGLSGQGKTWVGTSIGKALLFGPGTLWGLFKVQRRADRVIYLIPESTIAPFKHRLELMGLYEEIRTDRLLVRTLSKGPTPSLDDPRICEAVRGAHVIADTAVRFLGEADESNASEIARGLSEDLLGLLGAGALTVLALFHSPKSFSTQSAMTLENMIRGTGELGAILATAWGVKQIDAALNIIHVENLKPRDFQPCGPFQIVGRPYIDTQKDFALHKKPEECGSLADEQPELKKGGGASAEKREMKSANVALVRGWLEKDPPT
jgi:5S rRNA maturation endonuclease (ribonuclease M5)